MHKTADRLKKINNVYSYEAYFYKYNQFETKTNVINTTASHYIIQQIKYFSSLT